MLNKEIEKALNDQLNFEFHSAYIYYSMAAYFESISLPGMANWMRIQSMEEMTHGDKFFHFINERAGRVELAPIAGVPTEFDSPLAAFETALKHEQIVTARINKLVDMALAQSDHATNNFLQWFVAEQVEEEATADEIVNKLKLIEGARSGLFLVDQELATRVFTPPAGQGV